VEQEVSKELNRAEPEEVKDRVIVLGMVAHDCNPSYSGGRDGRITVQEQPEQSIRTYLKNKLKGKKKRVWRCDSSG
jgi:hypothetical protein